MVAVTGAGGCHGGLWLERKMKGGCVLRQLAGEEEKRKRREWELMRTKEWGRCQWQGKGLVVAGWEGNVETMAER